MLPLPPLSFTGGSAGGGSAGGGTLPWQQGDWTINVAGSGTAVQSASGGLNWTAIALTLAVVGVAWYLLQD